MTNTEGAGAPQPGWYPDPGGTTQLRWWDGARWTQHLQPPAAPATPAAPKAPAMPAARATDQGQYGQQPYPQQPYPQNPYAAGPPVQPSLGPNPAIYTPFIWIIALLPLLSAIAFAAFDMRIGYVSSSGYSPFSSLSMMTHPMYIVVSLLGWVIYGVSVWMAYLDWRALGRIGVVRPFHWAWTFLGGIVYVIGRSVVVRRRLGSGGLLPIWIMAAVYVITFIIVVVKIAALISSMFSVYNFS